jgi:glycine/sarcosine/betaine reductase complex component C subunit beta
VGKHNVGAASSQQDIMTSLIVEPLDRIGPWMHEVDRYATEMYNPEVTVPAGSGIAPLTNYRIVAAPAAIRNEIDRSDVGRFVREGGMPGSLPARGQIPAVVPFIGHATRDSKAGRIRNTMFVAKESVFPGRMYPLSDGLSFFLEENPKIRKAP